MTLVEFLMLLMIAGLCGSIAQAVAGYSRGGCLLSVALGLVGALLGTWLARQLGLGEILSISIGSQSFPVVWSIIGAALFVAVIGFLRPRAGR
jgi:uncharacterized membrane protein YeaQ/YmgE (transglycosylase-associated protein family)